MFKRSALVSQFACQLYKESLQFVKRFIEIFCVLFATSLCANHTIKKRIYVYKDMGLYDTIFISVYSLRNDKLSIADFCLFVKLFMKIFFYKLFQSFIVYIFKVSNRLYTTSTIILIIIYFN